MTNYSYPPARKSDVVDNYHGTDVPDPYRWLEDPDSDETHAWVQAQNEITFSYLHDLPAHAQLKERLTELWDYPRYSAPVQRGGCYFSSKNDGLQNQAVLYMQAALDSESVPVLDPNTLSEDGTVALTTQIYSHDGKYLAYGVSKAGSDWQEIRIRDVNASRDLTETIRWCKFTSIAWRHDNSGFFYNRLPEPGTVAEEDQHNFGKVYWHALGTDQAEDTLIYERPDAKELNFNPSVTEEESYLVLHVWHGTDRRNRIYYRPLESDGDFVRLLDDHDARYEFLGNQGSLFFFHTDLEAPLGRIIAIDVEQSASDDLAWREIVAQGQDAIHFVGLVNQQLVIGVLHHARHRLYVYTLQGDFVREIELPELGSIVELTGKPLHTEMFVAFQSFLAPTSILRFDFSTGELSQLRAPQVPFDAAAFESRQVFYQSKDGTRIPMFLVHKRGLQMDGENPTLLYGYGGFNISLTPMFNPSQLAFLEKGGVLAVANLRGGGEYGEEWHAAGTLERKQNVFDDFIAAGEWLSENAMTRPEKLAIMGGSNGGLLVAACMLQRPELFGAVVCAVPVIDMLRYHIFTLGRYWVTDYGNAEEDSEQFHIMHAYSPLHNVQSGQAYPPILITSADTDDRVVPSHAKKFAATLQAKAAAKNSILLRVETKAGHGLGKPTTKQIEEAADIYAFLFDQLGVDSDRVGTEA